MAYGWVFGFKNKENSFYLETCFVDFVGDQTAPQLDLQFEPELDLKKLHTMINYK